MVGDSGGCDVIHGASAGSGGDSSMKKMSVQQFCLIVLRLKVPGHISHLAGKQSRFN